MRMRLVHRNVETVRHLFTAVKSASAAGINTPSVSASATAQTITSAPDQATTCPFQPVQKPVDQTRVKPSSSTYGTVKPFSEMPTPKGLSFIGTYWEYVKNGGGKNLHTFSAKRHQELGPVFKEKTGVSHVVFVGDPETFRDVTFHEGKVPRPFIPPPFELYLKTKTNDKQRGLFFMLGDEWTNNRRILNSLLLRKQDHSPLYDHMETVLTEQLTKWHSVSQRNGGHVPNLEMRINELVLATLASFLMGRTYDTYAASLPEDASEFFKNSKAHWYSVMKMQTIPAEFAQKLGLNIWKQYESSITTNINIGYKWLNLVKDELESPGRDGLIHLLLNKAGNGTEFSRILVDMIVTSDTESTAKTWLVYAMAQNPKAQDKVFEELQTVCGKGEKLTSRHLDSTPYLRACVQEVMRVYPASSFVTRILEMESVIGGYEVPSGTLVALNVYACQRDAKHFPNPDLFWPERWFRSKSKESTLGEDGNVDVWDAEAPTSDTSKSNNKNTYLGVNGSSAHPNMSFGWGWGATRNCVFRKVSLVRMHLFIGRLIQEFHLRCDPVTPTMRSLLVPDKDINLRIAKRP